MVYKIGAGLIAVGIALWLLYGLVSVKETVKENLTQTHCNQGLLLLATTGYFDEDRIKECPADIRREVQGKRK